MNFGLIFLVRSIQDQISLKYVDFQKNAITSGFSKNAKIVQWTWTGLFLHKKNLVVSYFEALFKCCKRSDFFLIVVDCFKIGVKLGGV